jgi:predicted ATP-dependent endonuclease of OLD family
MKLHRLNINSQYKNLSNLVFNFKEGKNISLLVGQNGLGKSNLIEILAIIFKSLYQLQTLSKAKEWSQEYEHFDYELEYECKGKEIIIECKYDTFLIFVKEGSGQYTKLTFSNFSKNRKEYLPDYILGYYSGSSGRLKMIISEIEDIEKAKLKNDQLKEGKLNPGLRPFIFTESQHSEIILMTLILFIKNSEYSNYINKLLNYINIEAINGVEIEFNNPNWPFEIGGRSYSMDYLFNNQIEDQPFPFWHLKGKINKLLNFFNNQTIGDPNFIIEDKKGELSTTKDWIKEILQFDNLNLENIQTRIKNTFPEPKDLFDALEACQIIDIVYNIKNKIKKKVLEETISFFNLSEGEQQLITTIGLIIIFSKYETLFLFDEPDTHLNPKWQRSYIDLIKEFIPSDYSNNSHLIISTHSPLLVQAADERSDIFLFRPRADGMIEIDTHDFKEKNWRIDHVLLSKYFDLESTRPSSIDDFIYKRKTIIAKGKLTKKDREELLVIEKKLGYLPTGETIEEIEDKVLLRQMADYHREKLRNDTH